jgi:hypothetical protein
VAGPNQRDGYAQQSEATVPKYVVTGGQSGASGVTVGDTRYEPGETLTSPAAPVQWLIDQGYIAASDNGPQRSGNRKA